MSTTEDRFEFALRDLLAHIHHTNPDEALGRSPLGKTFDAKVCTDAYARALALVSSSALPSVSRPVEDGEVVSRWRMDRNGDVTFTPVAPSLREEERERIARVLYLNGAGSMYVTRLYADLVLAALRTEPEEQHG